jgi:hypothetical protein
MPIFMCERTFAAPQTEEDLSAQAHALHPCLEARDIEWLGSNIALDGTRGICMFEAADAERVREANRTANVPFDRVWAARLVRP